MTMDNTVRRLAAAVALSAVTMGASWNAGAQTAPITITAVTQAGPTLPQYTKVDIPMLREGLPKATNGKVNVRLFSYPEMSVNGPELIRLVRSGQVDIGAAALTSLSGDAPLLDGFDLPGLSADIPQARKVADALVPYANKKLERFGVKIIATYTYTPQTLYCQKPVKRLADLKGLKVRVPGPALGTLIESFGGQGVSLAFGETYTALERGTVDCAITGMSSGNGVKWYEVTSSLYSLPIAGSTAGYLVNLAWWNKLDPAIRETLEKTFAQVQDAQWNLGEEANTDAIACNTGNAAQCKLGSVATRKPMVESKPYEGDVEALRKVLIEKLLPAWVARCGEECANVFNTSISPITGVSYKK